MHCCEVRRLRPKSTQGFLLLYFFQKLRNVGEDICFEVSKSLSCCYFQFLVVLDVFCQSWIFVSNHIIQDIVLKAWSQCFICWLCCIIVVLYNLTSPCCVCHDVGRDSLEVCCRSHGVTFILDICKVQEVYSCHSEVVLLFN